MVFPNGVEGDGLLDDLAGAVVGQVVGAVLPDLETIAIVAGNIVIGLAGAALITFGAVTALSGTRAGAALTAVATRGAA